MISDMAFGMLVLVGFGCYRSVTSEGWDDSNILNWIRLFTLLCIHPKRFVGLFRLSEKQIQILKDAGEEPLEPFDFIRKDEFAENFPKTRKDV